MRRFVLVILLCPGLAGCGQKGDLYLPEKQAGLEDHWEEGQQDQRQNNV